MSKRIIKFKVGDYVYSKKQQMTSRVTAVRDFGCYIKRDAGTLCCPWDDVIAANKAQIREYLISQSKKKAVAKQELNIQFKPFHGGNIKKEVHKIHPQGKHILMLKEILTFLNLKYEINEKSPKSTLRHPISAVWHRPGTFTTTKHSPAIGGLIETKHKYSYGWTLVYDWMWLGNDVKFLTFVKAMQAKYKSKGLIFDCVFMTHNKVKYSGMLSIKPKIR